MKHIALGSIQKAIFEYLKEVLEETADMSVATLFSGMSSRALYKNLNALRRERALRQAHRSLRHLGRRNLIDIKFKSGEPYVRLSPLGKKWWAQLAFEELKLKRSTKWDGKWRMVIFDVPEKYGKARRALSYKVEEIGAVRLQDSVFVYPFPWRGEIELVSEFFRVSPYVRYIEAVSIDGEEKLRQYFKV